MQDLITANYVENQIAQLNVTDIAIAELNDRYGELKIKDFNDQEGYKQVRAARLHIKELRVNLDKKRKELVEKPKNIAKQIDAEAKRRREQLEILENKLSVQEQEFENEKERLKRERLILEEKQYQSRVESLNCWGFEFQGFQFILKDTFDAKEFIISNDFLRTALPEQLDVMFSQAEKFANELAVKIQHRKEEQERLEKERLAQEEKIKAQRDEELRLQREELDRKQMAIDIEKARIKKEREEKQAEYDQLAKEKAELLIQKVTLRHEMLLGLGIEYNDYDGSYSADFFLGEKVNSNRIKILSDADFSQTFKNYKIAKSLFLSKQKELEEQMKESSKAQGAEITGIYLNEEADIAPFQTAKDLAQDNSFNKSAFLQTEIKKLVCEILELNGIPVNEVTFNVSSSKWNIEHKGYTIFACNIDHYINNIKEAV